MTEKSQIKPNRPGCLLVLVAIFALYQIVRAIFVLQQTDLFNQQLSLPPDIQALIAVIWAIIFIGCSVGLAIANPVALRYSKWLLITFILYRIGQYAIFARADYDRQRLPLLVLVAAMILFIPIINLFRQQTISSDD